MATAHCTDYPVLDDEWVVDEEAGVDTSPSSEGHQRLIFNKPFREGTISAGITVREGKPLDNGWMPREGSIAFRYQDWNNYYFAGVGSHAERSCIGMLAGARNKIVVRIARSADDLPFDVKHLRTFTYSTKILCDRKLAPDLREAIEANIRFDAIPPHKGDSIN